MPQTKWQREAVKKTILRQNQDKMPNKIKSLERQALICCIRLPMLQKGLVLFSGILFVHKHTHTKDRVSTSAYITHGTSDPCLLFSAESSSRCSSATKPFDECLTFRDLGPFSLCVFIFCLALSFCILLLISFDYFNRFCFRFCCCFVLTIS